MIALDDGAACDPAPVAQDPWRCPRCSGPMRAIDTRHHPGHTRRRRRCESCGYKFTTREVVVVGTDHGTMDERRSR